MTPRAAFALAAVLVATGCTAAGPGAGDRQPTEDTSATPGSATGTSSPAEPPPPPPPPGEGTCHRLSWSEVVAPTSGSGGVACRREHTTETFHVGRVDRVVGGRLLAVDSRRVQAAAADECPDRLASYVGGTEEQRRLSMVRAVWFTPTVEESGRGADWLRCDVVALAGPEELLPLPGGLRGALDSEAGRERYGMCGTAEPGTDRFRRVACGTDHSWRALRTVPLAGDDYPGEDAARDAGEEPCTEAGRSAAADPLDFRWGYEWPTGDQWEAGQTYGICWAPVD